MLHNMHSIKAKEWPTLYNNQKHYHEILLPCKSIIHHFNCNSPDIARLSDYPAVPKINQSTEFASDTKKLSEEISVWVAFLTGLMQFLTSNQQLQRALWIPERSQFQTAGAATMKPWDTKLVFYYRWHVFIVTGWAVAQTCCISQCSKYRKSGIFGYPWEQNP